MFPLKAAFVVNIDIARQIQLSSTIAVAESHDTSNYLQLHKIMKDYDKHFCY